MRSTTLLLRDVEEMLRLGVEDAFLATGGCYSALAPGDPALGGPDVAQLLGPEGLPAEAFTPGNIARVKALARRGGAGVRGGGWTIRRYRNPPGSWN